MKCFIRIKKQAGFTLVEVLAALLIFSFAIIGLTRAGTESVRAVSILEHKTYAGIVADNQLVRARIKPLKLGTETGQEKVAGRDYDWRLETIETDSPNFFRLVIIVNESKQQQVLITRTAFKTGKAP